MINMENEITVNGKQYVAKEGIKHTALAKSVKGMKYCIVRTYSAGVFAGYLGKRDGQEGTVYNARRIWQWQGAASLSQLAVDGTSKPNECKFPCEVAEVLLTQIIEIIPCTEKARLSIASVKVWQQ